MRKHALFLFLSISFCCIGFLVGFTLKDSFSSSGSNLSRYASSVAKFEEVLRYLQANYFEPLEPDKLVEDAIKGMLQKLDPHTFYIPSSELKEINEQMEGSFEGIGIEFNIIEDTLYVVSPIAGGPSERAGIQAGDRIIKVDNENIAGVGITNNDVIKRLRGKKGTQVKLEVRRKGIKKNLEFTITRDKIPIYSVDNSTMVDKETGYIRIIRFASTTFREFSDHVARLKEQGMKNLILDLRNNPGGYLDQAFYVCDMFLEEGKMIVSTKGRIPSSNKEYRATSEISDLEKGGVIVLINDGSASASEIVAGAIQDWDRGLIIGTRSFGKGLVQQQHILSDESAIRVVVSRYFTPKGRCIQKPFSRGDREYNNEILRRYDSGEIFHEELIKLPDSLKYKTHAGRIVYGGGGIMPDIYLPPDTSGKSNYLNNLFIKNIFNDFALRYVEKNPRFKQLYKDGKDFAQRFEFSEPLIQEFIQYATNQGVEYNAKDFETSRKIISLRLKMSLARAAYGEEGFLSVYLQEDPVLKKAVELMPASIELARTGKFAKSK
ncbi:MAG: S41 family peptidase [Bacteroidia bacterium]|nr:S41 family peptidase [Bacteroidia bacterium]MDW8158111.1 S41 family peptidase [Bacteroidia bacterium]